MKTRKLTRRPITAAMAQALVLFLAGLQPTSAAWLIPPGATSGDSYAADNGYDYNATTNWNGGTIDDDFSTLGLTGALTISLNAGRPTAGLLNMTLTGASDFSLLSDSATSRAITLGGDVTADVTDGSQTITIGTTARPVTINLNNANRTFTVGSGDSLIINGVISNTTPASGKLTKDGSGTLILTANPTYTGFTTINAGTLQLGNGGAGGVLSSSSIITNNGSLVINHTSAQTLAAISGTGGVTMSGTGALTLNSGNTYSGGFTLNSGSVGIGSGTYAGFGSGTFTVTGGSLNFTGGSTQTITNSLNWQGTLVLTRSAGATPVTTWTGPLTLSSNLTLQMGASTTANNSTFTNNISGAFGITITGPTAGASLTLAGANNTFSGGLNWNSANVALNVNSATALGTGTFTIGAGGAINNTSGGAITLANNNTQAWNATSFTFTGSNALNLGTGAVTLGANVTATVSASTLTVGGAIGQTGGTRTLTKNGAGTLELSGSSANTYGGLTTVSAGTLLLNKSGTANAITATGLSATLSTVKYAATAGSDQIADGAPVTLANGGAGVATLDLNGVSDTIGSLTIGGASGTTTGQGAVQTGAGTLTLNGNLSYVSTGQGAVTHTISGSLNLGAATRTFSIQNNAAATELDIQAAISGSPGVGITKTSGGQMQLAGGGINTYTGLTDIQAGSILYGGNNVIADAAGIRISGGTLNIGTFNDTVAGVQMTTGTIAGTTGILTNTTAYDMQAGTVSAILGGSVGLNKTTSGTLFLNGVNTYTGPTVVSAGTLGGSGTIAGTVNVSAGANLSPGASAGAAGTLTLTDSSASALTLNSSTLNFDVLSYDGLTRDQIAITGNLVVNGVNTLFLNDTNGIAAGSYTLISYATNTGAGSIVFPNGSTTMGNLSLDSSSGTNLQLVVVSGYGVSIWKGTVDGNWDTSTTNWTRNGTANQTYVSGDDVIFDDTATLKSVTNGTVSPGSVTFNTTLGYTNAANIGGSGAVVKSGAGRLVLSGTNSYTGGTFINGGTVAMTALSATNLGGNGANITFNGDGTLAGAYDGKYIFGSLAINSTATLAGGSGNGNYMTFTGPVTGSGTLRFASSGNGYATTINLNSTANTFTGPIIYVGNANNGNDTITLNSLADGVGAGSIQIGANNRPGSQILNYGSGAIAPLTLSYRQIVMGGTTCGTTFNNNATNVNCTVTVNTGLGVAGVGNKAFTLGGSNVGSNTFAGAIADVTGSVISLTKSGNGKWILSGTNTYSGYTTIAGGALEIGEAGQLGGGVYAATITNTATLRWNSSADQSLGGIVSGAGVLNKSGVGRLTLKAANTYSGATSVSNGTLVVNGSLSSAVNAVIVNGGTLAGTGTIARAVNVNSGGILQPGDSAGTLTINSNLTIAAGATNLFALGTNSASVAVSGSMTLDGTLNVTDAGGLANGEYTLFTYGTLTDNTLDVGTMPGSFTGSISNDTVLGRIVLIVSSGAGSPPVASFTASAVSGVEPLQVVFTDTSTGSPTSWGWDFGDSNTSALRNQTNVYAAGLYTVSLTASNAYGSSTATSNSYIYVITAQQSWTNFYNVAADGTDKDGDGMSNLDEFNSGFNPTNANAYLHIISVVQTGASVRVTFLGSNGDTSYPGGPASRANVLEYTAGTANGGYTNDFTSTGMTILLSGGTGLGVVTNFVELSGATNAPARYYRVRVQAP